MVHVNTNLYNSIKLLSNMVIKHLVNYDDVWQKYVGLATMA